MVFIYNLTILKRSGLDAIPLYNKISSCFIKVNIKIFNYIIFNIFYHYYYYYRQISQMKKLN